MKINELKQLIRQLVKEEVSSEVNKVMGKVLVEMVREIKIPTINKQTSTEEESVSTFQPPILKTNNPKLNGVLAETARNFKPSQESPGGSSLAELVGGEFNKIGGDENIITSNPLSKIDYLKTVITENTLTPSALDGGEAVPDMLKKIFKKDFRPVMKAINEKKKGIIHS